jgi:hypothetical protein
MTSNKKMRFGRATGIGKINGAEMISKSYNIREFIDAVKGKPSSEIIMLANQEATQADRFF